MTYDVYMTIYDYNMIIIYLLFPAYLSFGTGNFFGKALSGSIVQDSFGQDMIMQDLQVARSSSAY